MHLSRHNTIIAAILLSPVLLLAQQPTSPLAPYIKENAPTLLLNHVTLIDGTGAAPQPDMRVAIVDGKISKVEAAGPLPPLPPGAKVLDLTGKTVIPGLVGMHEHLFYPIPDAPVDGQALYGEMADSAPRLYLAGGVTTARTAGSVETYTDLALKHAIDAGKIPGPKFDITGPYLEGPGTFALQMHELSSPEDAARTVDYWAAEGVTSFKAYNYLSADELKAAINHAHAHGIKITGHLCSVGFKQAAELGIDNLEHGILVDTEFFPGKKPDECPRQSDVWKHMKEKVDLNGTDVKQMIQVLVDHHVAVTSTLAIFETFDPNRPPMQREEAAMSTLSDLAARDFLWDRAYAAQSGRDAGMMEYEQKFEREFVAAGGLLMAGCDPTGYGGVVPGFGDRRNIELLVEAGFTPVEAIRIATLNGAIYMGKDKEIGSIAAGKEADLVVLGGNPAEKIENIEKVETVFKDGVGYDSAKLIESVKRRVGLR